jgi:hypothetical protein
VAELRTGHSLAGQFPSHKFLFSSGRECPCHTNLCMFRFGQRVEEVEELLDAGYLQGVVNALVDAYQRERSSVLIMGDIGADQGADAGGVDVGDIGEVDDERARVLGAEGRLKLEQRAEHYGTLKTQNALAGLGAVEVLNGEWLLG